ncbi:branched-chain alpha-keto acid dehydrogenase subunit E2 [Paenibacillus pectinilyticus]|uniref:Dihydrolipoamide acetyltransferase component of pyruvate dehydrogenase complex n=1 Tax=Paenibacillus pectinilyticus TaxID=512399 RepID=A0A1C0ZWH5_9BACL|nr:dihydrolipoamide acetyltransferase family protein [Paenibacillus pectinilyticus]OCT12455.1 branched-chain alpha-keto acid dehydrogenase subunit E2 [Paenibacillus pectinilyticus]
MNQTGRLTEVTVPHLAESLVSATIGKWLKKPGDYIEQYDVLCEMFTEKVNTEMPSPIEGKLIKIIVGDGETAAVGEAICVIEEPAGSSVNTASAADTQLASAAPSEESDQSMRGRFSPAVHRLAQDNRVDLARVAGTGLGGRITRKDVETFIASGGANATPAAVQAAAPAVAAQAVTPAVEETASQLVRSSGIHLSSSPQTPLSEAEGHNYDAQNEHFIDVTPMRNAIATKMRQSVTEIPHAWTMIEVDVTNLVVLRNKVKDEFMRREGINLTYLAFMLKAVVNAIKDYPIINSVWAVDKIIVKRDINISLSVGTEDSVMTPVIKKADQKNIAGLAREIDELSKKTRAGKLSLNDMVGGTFTVNNTGSFGSILSNPIINYPQAAIVSFESIVKRPVVIQDMIAVRSMVNLCLSLDHRILDGVICGRFLQRVKENLESYNADTKIY